MTKRFEIRKQRNECDTVTDERKQISERLSQGSGEVGFSSSQRSRGPFRQSLGGEQQQDRFSQPSQHNNLSIHTLNQDSQPGEQPQALQMPENERWGIRGLQALLDGSSGADQAALAHGMDLNLLGLDLNR